ncbi:RDD family protein [uncultured Thiothrix sp.]|uniref:RDD family protein n=1 Tax=uncultured Thiothrix sp. TaxID=223185 RepID=UPI002612779A|nr:RDD family protein [uncultured Thiothrix sp.]
MQSAESIYAAPKSHIEDLTLGRAETGLIPADKNRRFTNFLIDTAAYYALVFAIGFLVGVLGYLTEVNVMAFLGNPVGEWVFIIGILLLYYVPLEYYTGRSLGKLVTGTYVVSMDGSKPSFKQIFLRSLARFVPFEPFSFLGKTNSGWHDKWTNTQVCYKNK